MPVIKLGVLEIPYSDSGQNTGDVAEILEKKYGIFKHFWEMHGSTIEATIVEAQGEALELSMATNDPAAGNEILRVAYLTAAEEAKVLFRTFITMREMDGLTDGVPTKASLKGVSHRFKKKQGVPGRPSFVDTGLFLASMVAEIE